MINPMLNSGILLEGIADYSTFLFLGGTLIVFYFFFIRPQSKKAKDQQKFISDLKKGDKVVTAGGIHGKVIKDDEKTMLIEIDNNVKIRVEKSVVSAEMTKAAQESKD